MNAVGQLDEAFRSVTDFADHFAANPDIRLMLVDLLRASTRNEEARAQLEKLAGELESRGDQAGARRTRERLHALDQELHPGREPVAVPEMPGDDAPAAGVAAGAAGGLVFLDTAAFAPPAPDAPPAPETSLSAPEAVEPVADLVPLEVESGIDLSEPADLPLVGGFDATDAGIGAEDPAAAEPLGGLETMSGFSFDQENDAEPVAGLDPLELERAGDDADLDVEIDPVGEASGALEGLELTSMGDEAEEQEESATPVDLEFVDTASRNDLSGAMWTPDAVGADERELLDAPRGPELAFVSMPDAEESIAALEDRVLDDPADPEAHRALGEALLEGDPDRGVAELEMALGGYTERQDWVAALRVVDAILDADPMQMRFHQKRVELAYRVGDRGRLLGAYLALADSLARTGAGDKAVAVYRRVLEHEPANAHAKLALETLEPPAPSAPPAPPAPQAGPAVAPPAMPAAAQAPAPSAPRAPAGGADFVDLGAMVIEEEGPRDTRMVVEGAEEPPTSGDEQRDFEDMLAAFKKGIEENLDDEDYQAHYDLGVAFKEMGLLDEAIAEFQKALRSPEREGRLRTSEALGQAFFEKGQHAVAESVLRRAVEGLDGGDDEKIGLIYWLGRALEQQGKTTEARASYERALAVDIRFMDTSDRVHRLTAGPRA
jgi:tetratricopeptide (TPR) repeat protein